MKVIFLCILLFIPAVVISQAESSAYEIQRKKINQLLDARFEKFGRYESSLSKRTGIFGLKTKKDMQRSIDLLLDIMDTDNIILRETKALLEYKDLEKTRVETQVGDNQERINAYMRTISRLQDRNAALTSDMKNLQDQKERYNLAFFALITAVLLLFVWARKKTASA